MTCKIIRTEKFMIYKEKVGMGEIKLYTIYYYYKLVCHTILYSF